MNESIHLANLPFDIIRNIVRAIGLEFYESLRLVSNINYYHFRNDLFWNLDITALEQRCDCKYSFKYKSTHAGFPSVFLRNIQRKDTTSPLAPIPSIFWRRFLDDCSQVQI